MPSWLFSGSGPPSLRRKSGNFWPCRDKPRTIRSTPPVTTSNRRVSLSKHNRAEAGIRRGEKRRMIQVKVVSRRHLGRSRPCNGFIGKEGMPAVSFERLLRTNPTGHFLVTWRQILVIPKAGSIHHFSFRRAIQIIVLIRNDYYLPGYAAWFVARFCVIL